MKRFVLLIFLPVMFLPLLLLQVYIIPMWRQPIGYLGRMRLQSPLKPVDRAGIEEPW